MSERILDLHVEHPVPLDPDGRMAWVVLPRDLTPEEAERVCAVVAALAGGRRP